MTNVAAQAMLATRLRATSLHGVGASKIAPECPRLRLLDKQARRRRNIGSVGGRIYLGAHAACRARGHPMKVFRCPNPTAYLLTA
jgi:hypothetical protein